MSVQDEQCGCNPCGEPFDKAYAALDALGRSSASVALELKVRGIKGERGNGADCPISRYMCQEMGCEATLANSRIIYTGAWSLVLTPTKAVSHFIEDFDKGDYPELEESDE